MAVAQIRSAARAVSSGTGISQDNIIFAMLLFAFVVWITTKGELGTYLAFFKPGSNPVGNALGIDVQTNASSTTGAAATNAATGTPNIANPSASGAANPVGALTNNLQTGFGLVPMIQAIPGKIGNSLSSAVGLGNLF